MNRHKIALSSYSPPRLSSREAQLLAALERDRRSNVTLDEIANLFGRARAYEIVRSLTKKRVLQRLGRGRYLVPPFRAIGQLWAPSAPVATTHLLNEPHYLGGWWAWWFHHLTTQLPVSRIDAFVTRWRPRRRVANFEVFFHRISRERLGYGVQTSTIENVSICVSDLERTLLDALDFPTLMGSLSASIRRVAHVLDKADERRLVSYAARGSRTSTCRRLGILLERRGANPRALAPLRERVRESASLLSLWPERSRVGHVHPVWQVVENDSPADA